MKRHHSVNLWEDFVRPFFVLLLGGCAPETSEHAERLFVHEVLPLLNEKCFACHGE